MVANQTHLKEMNDSWERFEIHLDASLAGFRADLLKWMFFFWILNVVTIGGLMVAFNPFAAR